MTPPMTTLVTPLTTLVTPLTTLVTPLSPHWDLTETSMTSRDLNDIQRPQWHPETSMTSRNLRNLRNLRNFMIFLIFDIFLRISWFSEFPLVLRGLGDPDPYHGVPPGIDRPPRWPLPRVPPHAERCFPAWYSGVTAVPEGRTGVTRLLSDTVTDLKYQNV